MYAEQEPADDAEQAAEEPAPTGPQSSIKLSTLLQYIEDYEEATSEARELAERARDFYDGIQWTAEERAILRQRGQPEVTTNFIAKRVDTVLGTEVRTRTDPKALPRTLQHEDAAQTATDALRYVADDQKLSKHRGRVGENLYIEGTGGIIVEVETVDQPRPLAAQTSARATADGMEFESIEADAVSKSVEIRYHRIPWDRLVYDPHSRDLDFDDAKYMGELMWMDYDDAIDFCADVLGVDADEVLQATLASGNRDDNGTLGDQPGTWSQPMRKRIRLSRLYWRERSNWFCAVFTNAGWIVKPKPTGFVDERGRHICNMVIQSCRVDRKGNRYGPVRHMISPQEEINKRRSKALHRLNVSGVIAEDGAIPDDYAFRTALAKPDGIAKVERDAIKDNRVIVRDNQSAAQGDFQMLQQAQAELGATGPDVQAVAADTSVMSGRAVIARQQFASLGLEGFMEALRDWQLRVLRVTWCMIRQFWKEEKWLRVTDDKEKNGFRFVALNRRMTRGERLMELVLDKHVPLQNAVTMLGLEDFEVAGLMSRAQQELQTEQQMIGQAYPPDIAERELVDILTHAPEMAEFIIDNDVEALDVDLVLDESPDISTLQDEQFAKLSELARAGVPIPPDALVEASQLRNKEQILERIRPAKPNPEAAQAAQEQRQLASAMGQATVRKTMAEAQRSEAQAAKLAAEVPTVQPAAQSQMTRDQAAALESQAAARQKHIEMAAMFPLMPQF